MDVSFDPTKRDAVLAARGLDFADAGEVFAGRTLTLRDDRKDYGEERFQTYGLLADRVVMIVWTPCDGGRRVISMRNCHEHEAEKVRQHLR
jgi:uncharacterized DUF497 family protein